jgi:hypothetical protein
VAFTHEVLLPFRGSCVSSPSFYAAERAADEHKIRNLVNNPS